jgi:predicted MFS family arabinose efflux permease
MGDLVQRRQLILLLMTLGTAMTIGLAITNSLVAFEIIIFFVGIFSVVPQILVPLAADLAPAERKAGAIAIVWSALMLGVLFARVLSGIITYYSNYKNVYWMAVGLQFVTLSSAFFVIPNVSSQHM